MKMIEKVARAVCAAHDGNDPDQPTTGLPDGPDVPLWHDYRNFAIAALEAMREPSADMIIAGVYRANGFASAGNRMCNGYRAMIDKAIQESGE